MTIEIQIPYVPITISNIGITITLNSNHNPHLISTIQNLFLLNIQDADYYLLIVIIGLLLFCFKRLHAFSRPPPVHRKKLPRRPALHILFKPDDDIHTSAAASGSTTGGNGGGGSSASATAASSASSTVTGKHHTPNSSNSYYSSFSDNEEMEMDEMEDEIQDDVSSINDQMSTFTHRSSTSSSKRNKKPIIRPHDLPDSFAPLLSSSQTEIIMEDLTCDLLHATHVQGTIRLHAKRHEIPLDQDPSRPQLVLDLSSSSSKNSNSTNKGASKITAVASIGSDGISKDDDLDVFKPTTERSSPLVKHAGIILDPPIPLANVAPTLIHFPTLFEDNVVKYTISRIQIVRYVLDFIKNMSSLIEKVLWIVESKCQIHLGKVSLTPLYKGQEEMMMTKYNNNDNDNDTYMDYTYEEQQSLLEPQWRLNLSFSGHVLLFNILPIPFVNITLPTWIIPQPHALLEKLFTNQPLASAKLKREKIAEQRITLAILDLIESWDFKIQAVATPPALSTDLLLPGGLSVALETMHGVDVSGGKPRGGVEAVVGNENGNGGGGGGERYSDSNSIDTISVSAGSSMNNMYNTDNTQRIFRRRRFQRSSTSHHHHGMKNTMNQHHIHHHHHHHYTKSSMNKGFDANDLVPWKLDLEVNGRIDHDKISVSFAKCIASHDPSNGSSMEYDNDDEFMRRSRISLSGQFFICKPDPKLLVDQSISPMRRLSSSKHLSHSNLTNHNENSNNLQSSNNYKSVASIMLYPEKNESCPSSLMKWKNNLLQYDYEINIGDDTTLDAMSLSIGASHPMLKGGTIITTILENMYAHGTICARENSIIDMGDLSKKRNILKHLPAVGFTAGIQNFFIPEESHSYSDDGQTKCLPELKGGQLMVRLMGGFPNSSEYGMNPSSGGGGGGRSSSTKKSRYPMPSRNSRENLFRSGQGQGCNALSEGIKFLIDFDIPSFVLNNESNVSEFPELDIFDDQKLLSVLNGGIDGSIGFHLRPQDANDPSNNFLEERVFNPLERYEIDFSGSKVFVKIVESNATLGHRRIIIPSETTLGVSIVHSVVDMSFEGSTQCEFHWDFQGVSPILQVTENIGEDPQLVCHEDRQQVALLISSLRQGRLNLNVSSVGGLTITQAATSRENREGLYDWKFFNALVSPDEHSFDHMKQVLHDKRTMYKILQVVKLINENLEKKLSYVLKQVWRAKEIFDQEGVSDPGKAIPSYKMARLISLFLCGNDSQVDEILPIVNRATKGEGLDVLATKELMRKNISLYDDWAPEIDRAVRWVEVMLGSQEAQKPFVENNVAPLSVLPKYKNQFVGIPSAKELYKALLEKRHLPLDVSFSALVSRIAPYLSFRQIEYILQTRKPSHWQASDIRRLRYVYSVKKKVQDISESYGGLSFMPQSFFVSVFVGEATRASLRARKNIDEKVVSLRSTSWHSDNSNNMTLQFLRQRRSAVSSQFDMHTLPEDSSFSQLLSPAGRVASQGIEIRRTKRVSRRMKRPGTSRSRVSESEFQDAFIVGDSLLGPQDVAILLQAGLTSSMKGSTVVQLNQRMLLDLMASQPRMFAVAVLAEIGTPGGEGNNPRALASALMALLDLDQSSFTEFHRLDMHELVESWFPGLSIPRREDYLAGGRWASQSYYSAIYGVAKNILEDAEVYIAFKGHVQRVRHNEENDAIPTAKELIVPMPDQDSTVQQEGDGLDLNIDSAPYNVNSKLFAAINLAKKKIEVADNEGKKVLQSLLKREIDSKNSDLCAEVTKKYREAFAACADLLNYDKLAFHTAWFKKFYQRNYDALMVKSIYDNLIQDDDNVREWLGRLREATIRKQSRDKQSPSNEEVGVNDKEVGNNELYFHNPEHLHEQEIIDEINNLIFFNEKEREEINSDPLVRLLISNEPGNYNFTIVSAMGVITEGKRGLELDSALARLKQQRNVDVVRADTGTARTFEYNASKIEDAIESAVHMNKPYGLLGYSQGCANGLFCESLLQSGTPSQQSRLVSPNSNLVCRQLLFSAANGSMHGPAMEEKTQRLIVMCEQFFKYQQGYFSRAFTTFVLETLTNVMDSAAYQKFVAGGGGTFLHNGSRAFWREAQHLPHVPTCVLRGVLEHHTTPESLEMISNLLSKQAGSPLHDSQVHVYDAVGRPIYTHNRNSKILKNCEMGGAIQRTHHWSPLSEEVKFVETQRDIEHGTFLCAKDRHVFPWCDVNARFGFIKYEEKKGDDDARLNIESG